MKIAYLILAHNTPNHLSRLVRALDSSNASFFIHLDRKSDISAFRLGLTQHNVTFLEDRIPVYWGGFSDIEATIKLIKRALNGSLSPSYLVLLSGSDYPIKGPQYIESFFSANHGQQFMNLVPMPCDAIGKPLSRLQAYWLQTPCSNRLVERVTARLNRLINEQLKLKRDHSEVFKKLTPYAGSQWWALTQEACHYIISFIESKSDIVKFFKNIYMPDESFFQTIIGNSQFANDVTRNLTFADWSRPTGGPAVIDMDHLALFANTDHVMGDDTYGRGELLFARKFPDDSSLLTDFIDKHLLNRG